MTAAPPKLQIDFVSDVACPWCAIGLASLERALERLDGAVDADISFQPFELNPHMGPEGQDITEHLAQKYGSTPAQQAQAREGIRQRGAGVGFTFHPQGRGRVWNTFDAHRLLYWAGLEGARSQRDLKMALLEAYHGQAKNLSDPAVLLDVVEHAGLDRERAKRVLEDGEFVDAVRDRERYWQGLGIHAVPSVVIDGRHLIQGGQPPEVFEQALRQLAAVGR